MSKNTFRRHWRKWVAAVGILPVALSALFVVGGSQAAATHDPRCAQDQVLVDNKSETTLTPVGTRLVLQVNSCSSATDERSDILNVKVTVDPFGDQERVAFIGRLFTDTERQGENATIRRAELHLPLLADSAVCVEINGQETCVP